MLIWFGRLFLWVRIHEKNRDWFLGVFAIAMVIFGLIVIIYWNIMNW